MGTPYFLSIYFRWQIGLTIEYDKEYNFLNLYVPLFKIMFCLGKSKGLMIFNKEI